MRLRTSLAAILVSISMTASAVPDEGSVPPELEAWRGWVLDRQQHLRCPFYVAGAYGTADRHPCAWPGPLALTTTGEGARFSIRWKTYAEAWLPLPGGP